MDGDCFRRGINHLEEPLLVESEADGEGEINEDNKYREGPMPEEVLAQEEPVVTRRALLQDNPRHRFLLFHSHCWPEQN